jgi:diguanylate cyclase (GGDEF)-like protein
VSDPIQVLEDKLNDVTDLRTKIDVLNDLAWELRDTDPTRSRSLSEEAYELATSGEFSEQPYPQGVAASLRSLSRANRRASNLNLALSQSFQALTFLERVPPSVVKADVLQGIGISFSNLGNHAEGLEHCFKALKLVQTLGDREREASVRGAIGAIYTRTGDLEESLRTFEGVLRLNRELDQKTGEALTLNNRAMSYLGLSKYDDALTSSLQALQLAQESGFSALVTTATGTVGEVFVAMENYRQARHYLQQYLALARKNEIKRDEMWGLILLGEIDFHEHQDVQALPQLHQAIAIAQDLGMLMEQARCHKLLMEVYEQQGDLKQALAHSKMLHQVKESLFNEDAARRVANLQVIHQVETAKRDAEVQHLRTIELQKEIEERKNAQAALHELATTDPLTGLFNRREFFVLAEREFQRAQQDGRLLSAIVLDLDHFKNINDTYGHAAGDQVLAAAARMVRDNLRETEIVARYGGDEFVILLPGSNLTRALQVAKRLHRKLNSKTHTTERGKVTLTISLGIAELDRENCTGLDTLLDHADQALYAAKRAGRNHTATYQDIA